MAAAAPTGYAAVPSIDDDEIRSDLLPPAPTSPVSSPSAAATPFLSVNDSASTPPSASDNASVAGAEADAAGTDRTDALKAPHSPTMVDPPVAGLSAAAQQKPAPQTMPKAAQQSEASLDKDEKTQPPTGRAASSEPLTGVPHVPVTASDVDPIRVDTAPDHGPKPSLSSPLRSGSVDNETKIVHPKPLIQTTSDISRRNIKHPVPDLNTQSGSYMGNIAQLEATAERLSMTSSIDDAIRELHGELKRSDSRRSSILAASARGWRADDASISPPSAAEQLTRHRSNSSIVATNIAARHGGYSPAGYVMSPANSMTGRLRSGSKTSTGAPEIDMQPVLSRHGPGKASVRSIRSTKLSLAEISESEPISLTQTVLDAADAAPPLHLEQNLPGERRLDQETPRQEINDPHLREPPVVASSNDDARPSSARSNTTFQQAQDAFHDFDGVHCEVYDDDDDDNDEEDEAPPHQPPHMARPQSYMDPETGAQMLYYPARVPAMLNLPPKLSSRPKAAQRDHRRSEILNVMADKSHARSQSTQLNRHSAMPQNTRDSWLPDPLAGHRNSFAALSSYDPVQGGDVDSQPVRGDEPSHSAEPDPEPAPELRRPQRLSRMDPENRKSRHSRLDALPPQLRASVYFDLPSETPQVEVKDGSAMATLDSILDASANAPVSAFTDHAYAGKLGSEIYGKEKKRKSQMPVMLKPAEQEPKKRGSFMWLNKRSASHASDDRNGAGHASALGMRNDDAQESESQALASSIDGESVVHRFPRDNGEARSLSDGEGRQREDGESDTSGDEGFQGPPTTLLAELQLRKQQQKQRTQHLTKAFPNGMHATLLEMDAVAETQRKQRKNKRVNLAWEDPDANFDQDDEDDEDVPLAIIAAKSQGANNMADLDRPIGLMERRELEENEPLSHRRARLQGQDPSTLPKRPSAMALSAPMAAGGPHSPGLRPGATPEPEEEEEEFEGETLGERKRRLAAKEEAEGRLPRARPVSSSFSAELLSQFGDLDEDKAKKAAPDGEEETLGQRRRRLQAEREARQREMSYNNLTSAAAAATAPSPNLTTRLSMADVLTAHPKRGAEPVHDGRLLEEHMLAKEREAKMAALRRQMPTSLKGPTLERSGGFQNGAFNDGNAGGQGLHAMRSQPNLGHVAAPGLQHRASTVFGTYGMPAQQAAYGAAGGGYGGMAGYNNGYGGYGGQNVYAAGRMQPGMQMPMAMNTGSIDRVEQWRQGVWQ